MYFVISHTYKRTILITYIMECRSHSHLSLVIKTKTKHTNRVQATQTHFLILLRGAFDEFNVYK